MSIDCDDLDFPNQWELPRIKAAPDPEWADLAACLDKPLHWFYPDHQRMTPEATAVCTGCPVRSECLRHALRNNEHEGIWGGKSETERVRLRRAARGAA